MSSPPLLRSPMFVPSTEPDKMGKALASKADAVIFDLEDAVGPAEKQTARNHLVNCLQESSRDESEPARFVRVNQPGTDLQREDLKFLSGEPLQGIILPKAETAGDVRDLLAVLDSRWNNAGQLDVIPIVETARGVHNAYEIAQLEGVRCLAFGSLDYLNDVEGSWTADGQNVLYARSRVVGESRAAGAEPPLDTPWPQLDDQDGYRAELRRANEMGFQGKLLIHPKQIEPANEVFSPDEEEVEWARRVVEAFEKSSEQGDAVLEVDGEMVDAPVVKRARRVLDSFPE